MNMNSRKWNQGDMGKNSFAMQRKEASHRTEVNSPIETVFGRACRLDLSEPKAGAILFRDPKLKTCWTTTLNEKECHHYQAVLMVPELVIGRLDVNMREQGNSTLVAFEMSCTVLSADGGALFDDGLDGRMTELLERFGNALESGVFAEPAETAKKIAPARSRVVEHEIVISGNIDEIFALACPVAELKWVDNWKFDLIYSNSGLNETGCIFVERSSSAVILRSPSVDTYWYTNRYSTERHKFNAVWISGDLCFAHWEFSLTEIGKGQVRANYKLNYTGLTPDGNSIISKPDFEQRMKVTLGFLAVSMKQYVETGTIFRVPLKRKLQVAASAIGASLGRHLCRQHTRRRNTMTERV